MTVVQGMRFANTFYDIENIATSVPDEMLIRKKGEDAGRLFYKDKDGNVIDLFDKFASQIKAEQIQDLLDDVLQKANEYTDDAVVDVGGASTKIVRYVYLLRAAQGQKIFNIPLSTFDKDEDFIMFTTNTVMPDEGFTITNTSIIFDEGLNAGTTVRIIIIKNVPVGPTGSINANVLKPGTITEDLLDPVFLQKIYKMIENAGSGSSSIIAKYADSAISMNRPATTATDSWMQLETENASLEGVTGDMQISNSEPTDTNVKVWFEPTE